jgi:hypothetical protein
MVAKRFLLAHGQRNCYGKNGRDNQSDDERFLFWQAAGLRAAKYFKMLFIAIFHNPILFHRTMST